MPVEPPEKSRVTAKQPEIDVANNISPPPQSRAAPVRRAPRCASESASRAPRRFHRDGDAALLSQSALSHKVAGAGVQ